MQAIAFPTWVDEMAAEDNRDGIVAYRPKDFIAALPRGMLGRSTIYGLPEIQRPRSITIGRSRIFIESPDAWLRRLAQEQGAE